MPLFCYQENDENILNITSIYFVNFVLVCTGHEITHIISKYQNLLLNIYLPALAPSSL